MTDPGAIEIQGVSHRYGPRLALADLSLTVAIGERFALVGPNGSGKSTLFRLLSTLVPPQSGTIKVLGHDVARETPVVRLQIGVVFQTGSLDRQLSVRENLQHQGRLYGLRGATLAARIDEELERFALGDRAGDRAATLSGGLRRRVELAKALLHRPRLLLLDEPSTGLDPAVRAELWERLDELARADGVTVVLTSHLLDEAARADRVAVLDAGRLVALDAPDALRRTIGGDSVTIETDDPQTLAHELSARLAVDARVIDGRVRFELPDAHQAIARIVEALPGRVRAITVAQPTLEDVFIARTGHRYDGIGGASEAA
ncbi:MAG: ABC transporter ATP-binding protein [Pirellulales bacterium]|nr:ABC transporter ATP-binding protein [Pirellulales bacterium]